MFRTSCKAHGGPPSAENRAHRPGGDGEPSPGGVRSLLQGLWGAIIFGTGRTGLGGTGSPAQGVFGASCKARGEPSSSENRAHRPGGDGEYSPGGVRSLLLGPWGAIIFGEPGAPAWGGRGVQAQGVFGASCKAYGGPSSSKNRAHRPRGDGESSQGGVRSLLQGLWGAIIFREPGAPARGGTGVQPRGCSEPPARPVGSHHPSRTGRTGPGGGGESIPGGGPSILQGWAARPVGPVGRQPSRWCRPTCLGGGGGRSGAGSNRGAPSGGACPAVRARQLGGPWAAAVFPEGYPVPLRRRAAPLAGPRAGSSGRKAVLTPRLSESCDRVAPHP